MGGALLEGILSSRDLLARAKEAIVPLIWADVVGPAIAQATETLFSHHRRVYVTTKSGPWAHDLMSQRQLIIAKLNERLGGPYIEEIHFEPKDLPPAATKTRGKGGARTGRHRRGGSSSPPHGVESPPEGELASIQLTSEEERTVEAAAASIHDPDLRERVRRALKKEYRIRRWKRDHGWRECPFCSSMFVGPAEICDYCQYIAPPVPWDQ